MQTFELAPPIDVPADLAAPTPAYVRHARLAFLGVVMFLVVYLGLTAWFGAAVWRLTFAAPPEDRVLGFFISLPALFLFGFLLKGLFRIRSQPITGLIEVSADDQPDLIAFVHRVANEAGAPKPHRIFLAPAVNAAVFYDVGFLNLLFPSRKNLLIGMGLIETLTLDELRAVLAHEFGHFAQGTMRVGSWVYVARQVVADLITRRDAFDSILAWIARADLRIAWIGWGMQIIVWSIRSILDTLFRGVMLLERALSREMEFQADLVAVSVSGSDSLVHALHCLGAADDAFDRALQFSAAEVRAGHPVEDLFAVQSRVLARMAEVLGDPNHGRAPPLPAADRASHRVFEAGIAEAPPMWSTHPPNHEREANAKRRYVASVLDARSAWAVVRDAPGLRQRVTRDLLELELNGGKQYHPVPLDETFARLDEQFDRPHLAPALRGAYVNRALARHAEHPSALRDPAPIPLDSLGARLDALYPPSLPQDLERLADLTREHTQLQGMRAGALKATGGVLRFRGREVNAGELPELVDQVAAELAAARDAVHAHDREVRAVHRAAAELVEPEWVPQLDGLLALVHYAEHVRADLDDATKHLRHVVAVVTADGAVSSREMNHLMEAALEAHIALDAVVGDRGTVATGSAVRSRLRATWTDAVPGRARLPEPEPQQIGEWLPAFEVTAPMLSSALGTLRSHALDELIATEARIARAWRGEEPAGDPPEGTPAAPPKYPRLPEGKGRDVKATFTWWDRFLLADGPLPGAARFAVALAVLAPAVFLSATVGEPTVYVHNGLGVPVVADVGGYRVEVPALGDTTVSRPLGAFTVRAETLDGRLIETFDAELKSGFAEQIYNVAGASLLVRESVSYGNRPPVEPKILGPDRWSTPDADHVFEPPPESISSSSGGGYVSVLRVADDYDPAAQVSAAGDAQMALVHLQWDPADSPRFDDWASLAADLDGALAVLERRLAEAPSVALERLVMDQADPPARAAQCARIAQQAAAKPDDDDLRYLSIRCMEDSPAQDVAFLEAWARFPDNFWLGWAAGNVQANAARWPEALATLEAVRGLDGALGSYLPSLIAKLRRVNHGAKVDLADLASTSPALAKLVAFEDPSFDPTPGGPPLRALHALCHRGPIPAMSFGGVDAVGADTLTKMAASAGAPPELIEAARPLPLDQLSFEGAWAAWVVRQRAAAPAEDVKARLLTEAPQLNPAMFEILTPDGLRAHPEALEDTLVALVPHVRGQVMATAVLLAGDAAPPRWRYEAETLTFCNERPHLGGR